MNIETIAKQIKANISEGSKMLESPPLRLSVETTLKRNKYLDENLLAQMNAELLMTEVSKNLIATWPGRPALGYDLVQRQLKPLAEIQAILDSEELNEWVVVRPNCAMRESRMPLEEFKKALWAQLFWP